MCILYHAWFQDCSVDGLYVVNCFSGFANFILTKCLKERILTNMFWIHKGSVYRQLNDRTVGTVTMILTLFILVWQLFTYLKLCHVMNNTVIFHEN